VEDTVASLSSIAQEHTMQINKVIDKNERLFQMLESVVVGGQAGQLTAPQKAGRCKIKPRK